MATVHCWKMFCIRIDPRYSVNCVCLKTATGLIGLGWQQSLGIERGQGAPPRFFCLGAPEFLVTPLDGINSFSSALLTGASTLWERTHCTRLVWYVSHLFQRCDYGTMFFAGALICFDLLMHQGIDAKPSDISVVENCSHSAKVCWLFNVNFPYAKHKIRNINITCRNINITCRDLLYSIIERFL